MAEDRRGPKVADRQEATHPERQPMPHAAMAVIAYFVLYWGWLWMSHEKDYLHWLTMVLLPLLLVTYFLRRGPAEGRSFGHSLVDALARIGVRRGHLTDGLPLGIGLGIGMAALMLSLRPNGWAMWFESFHSGRGWWLLPVLFVLMLLTAATTEDFFFRGCLQGEMTRWKGVAVAIPLSTLAFIAFHVPYRMQYYHDLGTAWSTSAVDGILGGVLLGIVYWRSRGNLVASIVCHALINSIGGLTHVHIPWLGI